MGEPEAPRAPVPSPSDRNPFLSRGKLVALVVSILLLFLLFYPFEVEPGVRWGYRTFQPASRPGLESFDVEPLSVAGKLLFRNGFGRGGRWYRLEVHPGNGTRYPKWGAGGRQEPGSPFPLYEIWMDAEAEGRVRRGEVK